VANDTARGEPIELAYPSMDPVTLTLVLKAPGDVTVQPGTSASLLAGSLECNVPDCRPAIEVQGGEVRFTHPEGWRLDRFVGHDRVNRLSLELGAERPYRLEIKGGVSRGSFELGGLPLTGLVVQTGTAESHVVFSRAVLTPMSTCKVYTGAGTLRLEGLLNASAEKFEIKGAAGTMHLHFTGDGLNRDTEADVAAAAASCSIVIGKGVPARVKVSGATGQTRIGAGFTARAEGASFWGGEYVTPEYDRQEGPRLEVDVTTALGALNLDVV
jgi:hypothetical protein